LNKGADTTLSLYPPIVLVEDVSLATDSNKFTLESNNSLSGALSTNHT